MKNDLATMIADLPKAVTWGAVTFNAVVGDVVNSDNVDIAGVEDAATLTVDYVLADAGAMIEENELVVIDAVSYRVSRSSILPDGLTGHFECVGGEE